jgi:DNA invertase Pin-like site-specific DNA recombinase
MKSNGTLRAALYARVSTPEQSADMQLDDLRVLARQRGWQAAEYTDCVTGAEDRRPGLDRMLAEVRAGHVDVVAVWRFDRFARSTRHLIEALEEFRVRGVEFVSVREQVDTATPMGRAMFAVIAAMAEFERELLRERVTAGMRRAAARGVHCGRPPAPVDTLRAKTLLDTGRSLRHVANVLGIPRSTLQEALAKARR